MILQRLETMVRLDAKMLQIIVEYESLNIEGMFSRYN